MGLSRPIWTEVCVSKESSCPHRCMVAWPASPTRADVQCVFMSKWQVGDGICQKYFLGGVGGVYFGPRFVLDTLLVSFDDRGDMDYDAWVLSCALCRRFGKWDMQCIGWVWVWYEIQNAKWANECLKTSFLLSCEYLAKATGGFSKVSAIASTAYPAVALSLRAMWQNEALSALHLTDFQPGAQNETYKKYVHISELYGSI